jgi:adenylate cyclase
MTEELQLALLGNVEVRRAGVPITGLDSGKTLALLCYLAVTGRPHLRPTLAGLLWGEMPEANAHNNLRKTLSKLRPLVGSHLSVTRQAVAFNQDSPYWLDVDVFESVARCTATVPAEVQQLQEAVALYRGDFMEGFYVRQAPAFEEWVLAQRARLRELALQGLHTLAAYHTRRGESGHAAGIDYTTRLLALDPWREEAHQQLMLLLAHSGQRSAALAQYETCCRLLAEELGVEPGEQTTRLYEQIRDDKMDIPLVTPALMGQRAPALPPPSFLQEGARDVELPVFVARERELAWLAESLNQAIEGQGHVLFVTGGPGQGKTALLGEFARRAMDAHPALLVARGSCNAYAGVGDPYLPFREVMGLLTGDVEPLWAAGAISHDQARRLWQALPVAVEALVAHGPHVVPTLVLGEALLARAEMACSTAPWLMRLRESVEQGRAGSDRLQQSYLFQQVSNVLHALAKVHPLLLILDDLQWVDRTSIGLLFHLGRRLAGHRILIAGAYRPEEVDLNHFSTGQGELHPLEKVLNEFKCQFGDVWLDLGQAKEAEGRGFVNAFLDTEPNRFGLAFREALHRHTGGHPLFTVELLRTMQERGDLVQKEGHWVEGPALDWDVLPARVEAVIEERVGRLEEELRELLTVASVEGEEFTAQVLARVEDISERQLLRTLSRELEKHHRLVREDGELQVGRQRLSRYQFVHALFQSFLYHRLGAGERRLLHRQIAAVLEALYEGCPEELAAIAPQLARHYAGDAERERHYARLAGERAAAHFANAEAVSYFSQALDLTPEKDLDTRYDLLLAREKVYDLQGEREAQQRDLLTLEELAQALDDNQKRAEVALRQARYYELTGEYAAALTAAQAAVGRAQASQDLGREAAGSLRWGEALLRQGDYEAARARLEGALALARDAGEPHSAGLLKRMEATILHALGVVSMYQSDYAGSQSFYERSLHIQRQIGNRQGEAKALDSLGMLFFYQSDYGPARDLDEQALQIQREIGDLFGESRTLGNLGVIVLDQGLYARSRTYYEQARHIFQEIDDPLGVGIILGNLGEVLMYQGDYAGASAHCERAVHILREIGHQRGEAMILTYFGEVSLALGRYREARTCFEQALHLSRKIDYQFSEGHALTGLSLFFHYLGDNETALKYGQQAIPVAQEIRDRPRQCSAYMRLGHALAGLGHLAEAEDAYQRALDIRRDLGQPHLATEPLAGLARVSLALGDLAQAHTQIEEILNHLETGTLEGTVQPIQIYLTCFHVLRASDDPRAGNLLDAGHRLLQELAAKIDDVNLRHSFLENVAAHREIVAEWIAQKENAF